jgi:hypothetical protein
MSSLEIELID